VLLARYGTRASTVWDTIEAEHDEPLAGDRLSTRELAWMVDHEHIVHLTDVILRRTDLAFTGSVTYELLGRIAGALAPLLSWDETRVAREIDEAASELRDAHGVALGTEAADA
jgi:glycerol-3-phosphate dehydrogenase